MMSRVLLGSLIPCTDHRWQLFAGRQRKEGGMRCVGKEDRNKAGSPPASIISSFNYLFLLLTQKRRCNVPCQPSKAYLLYMITPDLGTVDACPLVQVIGRCMHACCGRSILSSVDGSSSPYVTRKLLKVAMRWV
ncbi:hypothetical protein BS78_09G037500 [Paspalum vaginatum]|nr:hypothetical protein BS78_09G037500 [Paspalum vaginatum]